MVATEHKIRVTAQHSYVPSSISKHSNDVETQPSTAQYRLTDLLSALFFHAHHLVTHDLAPIRSVLIGLPTEEMKEGPI